MRGNFSFKSVILSVATLFVVLYGVAPITQAEEARPPSCDPKTEAFCFTSQISATPERLEAATVPKIATPAWMIEQKQVTSVTYKVETRGNLTADLAEFKSLANQTLNSSLGWSRLGVSFNEVNSGGDFTLVLAEADEVPKFSSGCDSTYSCNVGRYVIINEDRWMTATPSWNKAGGSLRDYRHMVINHETGHWLGHGHQQCGGSGQQAPVMQQQSIDLQGCKFNPWPLASELYAPTLGIRS